MEALRGNNNSDEEDDAYNPPSGVEPPGSDPVPAEAEDDDARSDPL
jgi:hypothetical protein